MPQFTLRSNVTSSFISPYAMIMYTSECPKQLRPLVSDTQIKLLADGKLYIKTETHIEIYTKGFCIENFYDPNAGKIFLSAFLCKTDKNLGVQLPLPQTSKPNETNGCTFEHSIERLNRWLRFTYTFCGFFSLLFLFLSLFFYMTLPELGNFQGNIICAYIISTIVVTILLMVNYNIRVTSEESDTNEHEEHDADDDEFFFTVPETFCQGIGYLLYCSALLMFTWMSVLCFDLMR